MRYKITGKNGFIGKHIVKYVGEENLCDEIEPGCTVIHLAAYGNHYFQSEPEKILKANIIDLIELVKEAQEIGVEKFYNISTSSITLPVQTMYSASKLFGETYIDSLKDERFVSVRPYSVYGEGEAAHRFIPTVIRHLKSGDKMKLDVQARHDWIYIRSFVEAMFDGYKNIGTGVSHSNWEIVQSLEKISGKQLNYEESNLRNYDTLDWVCKTPVPHISIFDGLKQTYDAINNA